MKIKPIFPIVLIILMMATFAVAGTYHHGYGSYHGCGLGMSSFNMSDIDADEDGVVTFEEFGKKQMEKMRSAFDTIDTNKDGEVDEMEWTELMRVHGLEEELES